MPANPAAPATARRAVASLSSYLDTRVVQDAQLLVSELVTNSLLHGGLTPKEAVELCVRASPQTVMVEVADRGRGFGGRRPRPRARERDGDSDGQPTAELGFWLLDTIAYRWGIVEADDVRVWFELRPGSRRARDPSVRRQSTTFDSGPPGYPRRRLTRR